jgi:uncharacterized membrane protein (DUF4010 family)
LAQNAPDVLLLTLVALCLGALVGLERMVAQEESRGEKDFPGVRTFAFLALVGALAVLLARELGELLALGLFAATAAFLVFRYRYDASERGDPGYTTEIASLCTFAVGALAQAGYLLIATVITIAMVALLRSKRVLHRAGELLSPVDMEVLIRFLVITGIVLPLLPDTAYDPYGVLRPRDVWRMVVLISGLSFVGYVLMRFRAQASSWVATGILGGLVSSSATAAAYARAARDSVAGARFEGLVVLAAATAFIRIGIEVAVVAPQLLPGVALPLGGMCAAALLLGLLRHRPSVPGQSGHTYQNPLTLRTALTFAAIYAVVLVLTAAARDWLADLGTYAVTAAAATVGADAPTLSLARLYASGELPAEVARRGIGWVAVSTTLGKAAILVALGSGPFVTRVVPTLIAVAALGAAIVYWG